MERYLSSQEITKYPLGKKYKKNSRGGKIFFVRLNVLNKSNKKVVVEFCNKNNSWSLEREERVRIGKIGIVELAWLKIANRLNSSSEKKYIKLSPTKKDYKKIYSSYPDADELGYYKVNSPEYVRVRNILESVNKKSLVYDVGCNSGGIGKLLIEKRDCKVFGSELCPALARKATAKGLTVFCGWAEKTPFSREFFDVVVLDFILEHVISLDNLLIESLNTLKKGGMIIGHVPTEFGDWGKNTIEQHPEHLRALSALELKNLFKRFKLKEVIIKKEKLVGRNISDYYFFKAKK